VFISYAFIRLINGQEDTNDTILGSKIPKKTPARTLTAKPKVSKLSIGFHQRFFYLFLVVSQPFLQPVADSTTVLSTPKKEPSYLELAKDMIFGW
jgi:hypothetical protein